MKSIRGTARQWCFALSKKYCHKEVGAALVSPRTNAHSCMAFSGKTARVPFPARYPLGLPHVGRRLKVCGGSLSDRALRWRPATRIR